MLDGDEELVGELRNGLTSTNIRYTNMFLQHHYKWIITFFLVDFFDKVTTASRIETRKLMG